MLVKPSRARRQKRHTLKSLHRSPTQPGRTAIYHRMRDHGHGADAVDKGRSKRDSFVVKQDLTTLHRVRLIVLTKNGAPAQLQVDGVVVCWRAGDIAAGPDELVRAGRRGGGKPEQAGAARQHAGGEPLRRGFDRNLEDRLAHGVAPVREALALREGVGRPGRCWDLPRRGRGLVQVQSRCCAVDQLFAFPPKIASNRSIIVSGDVHEFPISTI
jgi:hypothetical protein